MKLLAVLLFIQLRIVAAYIDINGLALLQFDELLYHCNVLVVVEEIATSAPCTIVASTDMYA